jgi:hypothetical protein
MLAAMKFRVPAIPGPKTPDRATMGVDTRALLRVTTDEGMTTPLRTATEARMKTRLTRRTKGIPIAGTIANKSEINDPTTLARPFQDAGCCRPIIQASCAS